MATKNAKDAPKIDPTLATVVTVEPNEPYPDGSPPDPSAVVARVHPPQAQTEAAHWQEQSKENLAAGGIIAGAEAYTPPEPPPPPEPEPEAVKKVKKEDTPQQGRKSLFGK